MAGLLSALTGNLEIHSKVAEVVIAPLDDEGHIDNKFFGDGKSGARILQYWPDSLSDDKSANWQSKDIPGAPLPLYQWVNGAERPLSFTAIFSRDMYGEIGKDVEEDKYNVDIDAAAAWLRSLSANDYGNVADMRDVAIAPPVLWLLFTGTKLGYNMVASKGLGNTKMQSDSNGVYCLMTECGVTRRNWFQDGTVKFAEISLSFVETMQIGQKIWPYGRRDFMSLANKYTRNSSR
jgi:hypothetical protein